MDPGAIVYDGALLAAIPIAMLAGLLSFLAPCVLPLVPGYFGFVSEMAAGMPDDEPSAPGSASAVPTATLVQALRRLVIGVLLFITGFTVVFLVAFVVIGTLALYLIEYRDIIIRVSGVFVIAMGLVFIGAFGTLQRTIRPTVRANMGLAEPKVENCRAYISAREGPLADRAFEWPKGQHSTRRLARRRLWGGRISSSS